jgi:hypothetical protein
MQKQFSVLRATVVALLATAAISVSIGAAAIIQDSGEGDGGPSDSSRIVPGATVIHNPGPGKAAPGFVSGTFVSWDGDTAIVRAEPGGELVRLRPTDAMTIGGVDNWEDLDGGDKVQATGAVGADGTVLVRVVSVNIVQIRGTLLEVTAEGSWMVLVGKGSSPELGSHVRVTFDAAAPPLGATNDILPIQNLAHASIGSPVIVIGIAEPGDSPVLATRVDHWEQLP